MHTEPVDRTGIIPCYRVVRELEMEYLPVISFGAGCHEPPLNVGGNIVVASVKGP